MPTSKVTARRLHSQGKRKPTKAGDLRSATATLAAWLVALGVPASAADVSNFSVSKPACDRVATLGPGELKEVLLAGESGEIVVDIDGDKIDERLTSRWEMTSMQPRLWFIESAKGEPYLGASTRSIEFKDERGSVLYPKRGYETVWIKLDGEVFALGMYDERRVIATELIRFRSGKAESLCTFDHTTSIEWAPATAIDEKTCNAATKGMATNLPFEPAVVDWQKGLRPTMLEIQGVGTAETDIDRDGKPDALVRWDFQSGAGRGCALRWLDVHQDRPNAALRKALLAAQGFQMDPAGRYSYYSQMLPRDEFGWSRCGDANEIALIEGRAFVSASDRLTALDGGVPRLACLGKKITRWRVKSYVK